MNTPNTINPDEMNRSWFDRELYNLFLTLASEPIDYDVWLGKLPEKKAWSPLRLCLLSLGIPFWSEVKQIEFSLPVFNHYWGSRSSDKLRSQADFVFKRLDEIKLAGMDVLGFKWPTGERGHEYFDYLDRCRIWPIPTLIFLYERGKFLPKEVRNWICNSPVHTLRPIDDPQTHGLKSALKDIRDIYDELRQQDNFREAVLFPSHIWRLVDYTTNARINRRSKSSKELLCRFFPELATPVKNRPKNICKMLQIAIHERLMKKTTT